jgi:hypothetical protein
MCISLCSWTKKKNKSRVAGGEALFSFGKERGGWPSFVLVILISSSLSLPLLYAI